LARAPAREMLPVSHTVTKSRSVVKSRSRKVKCSQMENHSFQIGRTVSFRKF
jgi:hypothetical protein